MAESDVTRDLPPDLAAILRDQSVIIPQHAAVFEAVAAWAKAPSDTASAGINVQQTGPPVGVGEVPASGAANTIHHFGAPPCPFCGGDQRVTSDFHGHWLTHCVHCGEEL